MAYNLATIRNRVINDKLDDPTYDTTVVDSFINDAQRQIFNSYELPFMEKEFSGQLPADEYIFAFPTDLQIIQSMKITSPVGQQRDITFQYMKFAEFNRLYPTPLNNDSGEPLAWTTHAGRLHLARPTDQLYQLDTWYIKSPTTLTDAADVPDIPEAFSEALVLGAYYRVLERNEDFDLAAFIKNGEYAEQIDLMTQRLGKRQTGKPMVMGQPLRYRRR